MHAGEDLLKFILAHVSKIEEQSVIVISSKIVAVSERRIVQQWNEKSRKVLIHASSDAVLTRNYPPLTYQNGIYTAAAGIDTSNGNGALILPPKNAWITAHRVRAVLQKKYNRAHLGVIIADSMPLPGKQGVVSSTIACAGFLPVQQYKGKKDIFGRVFEYSSANHADALAAAAGVTMGEGAEQCPLAIITGAPISFTNKRVHVRDITIPLEQDIYKPLSESVRKRQKKSIK
jgi:dihydrofolate synthase / folylpolyglutamate synthase